MDLPLSIDAEIDRLAQTIAVQLAAKIKAQLIPSLEHDMQDVAEHLTPIEPPAAAPTKVEAAPPSLPDTAASVVDGVLDEPLADALSIDSLGAVVGVPPDEMVAAVMEAAAKAVQAGVRVDDVAAFLGMPEHPSEETQALELAAFREAIKHETRRQKEADKAQRAEEAAARRVAKMAERRKKEEAARKQRLEATAAAAHKKFVAVPATVISRELAAISDGRRRRILIVGLLPSQTNIINQEFSKAFDLAFFSSDRIAGLRNASQNVDLVVTMTDFISHAHEEGVQGSEDRRRVSGGMTRLRNTLRDYYNEAYPPVVGAMLVASRRMPQHTAA